MQGAPPCFLKISEDIAICEMLCSSYSAACDRDDPIEAFCREVMGYILEFYQCLEYDDLSLNYRMLRNDALLWLTAFGKTLCEELSFDGNDLADCIGKIVSAVKEAVRPGSRYRSGWVAM